MSLNLDLSKLSIKCDSKIKILSHKQGLNLSPSNILRTKETQDVSELNGKCNDKKFQHDSFMAGLGSKWSKLEQKM